MLEDDKYWARQDKLEDIAAEIGLPLRKWFRLNVRQHKAKYNTVRVYCDFGIYDLHQIVYPGYAFIQKHFQSQPLKFINSMSRYPLRWFEGIIAEIQIYGYNLVYKRACKKNPELAHNILEGADHREFLKDLYTDFKVTTNWKKLDAKTGKWVTDD